ncbi:MAG: hypothetical protein K8F26_09160 [Thiobacillus sp.]|jgi:hypothetical protein|nr:hypothetical protein [Thiobacillus sp.]
MLAFRSAALLAMFLASTAIAQAEAFPKAPPRLKDAEAQGLVRMNAAELKESLPGKWKLKGTRGKREKTFNPDGSADRSGFGEMEGAGTWRIDEQNNAYCNTFSGKKGIEEGCFAVFRVPDGTHYFDYEIDTGFYHGVRRREGEE